MSGGVYRLPPEPKGRVPREDELQPEEDVQYSWSDILGFIIATYQVMFPILGIMFVAFLFIWGVLWLLAR